MSVLGYFKAFACTVCVCRLRSYKKNKETCTGKTWKIAIFSTPGKHSHWLVGCIQKAKTFIALLAKATFLHSGAVQRKSTKCTHITVTGILFEQLYWLGLTPLHFFSIIWKGASKSSWIEPTEMNFPWKLLEIYFFSSKLWNFKGHF